MNILDLHKTYHQGGRSPITPLVLALFLAIASPASFASQTVAYGFDGTGKNVEHGAKTNVYHFLQAHQKANPGIKNVYALGVGSETGSDLLNLPGTITGVGGRARINAMYDQLVKNFQAGHKGIAIVGFSRGAALSREFAHVINERGDPLQWKKDRKPQGLAPSIQFMALFDTVYSFGLPIGGKDYGYRHSIAPNVKAVAHATAGLEKRNTFDLWSIHFNPGFLNRTTGSIELGNWRAEKEFNVGHDDVGGAEEYNYYGYPSLLWVIEGARLAGLNISTPPKKMFRRMKGQQPSGHGVGKRQVYFPEGAEPAPTTVPAKSIRTAQAGNCRGQQIYLSGGSCYSCPDGYRRYSPTRKMTHPKACIERGCGSKSTKAKYAWELNGCQKGEFEYDNNCMKCPSGTERIHFAGLDTGTCRVRR